MKVINRNTGAVVAEIITNHSMSIDDCMQLMRWTVNDDGEVIDNDSGEPIGAYYDELEMVYGEG